MNFDSFKYENRVLAGQVLAGLMAIAALAGIALGVAVARKSASANEPVSQNSAGAFSLEISAADAGLAKEACRRRHLSWSRIELASDGTHLDIYCVSDEVAAQQLRARMHELRGSLEKVKDGNQGGGK